GSGECAAAQYGDTHRSQIVHRHHVSITARRRDAGQWRIRRIVGGVSIHVAAQWKLIRRRRQLDAGKGAHRLYHAFMNQIYRFVSLVSWTDGVDLEREQM